MMICYNFNHDLKLSLKALPSPNPVVNYSTQKRLGEKCTNDLSVSNRCGLINFFHVVFKVLYNSSD